MELQGDDHEDPVLFKDNPRSYETDHLFNFIIAAEHDIHPLGNENDIAADMPMSDDVESELDDPHTESFARTTASYKKIRTYKNSSIRQRMCGIRRTFRSMYWSNRACQRSPGRCGA